MKKLFYIGIGKIIISLVTIGLLRIYADYLSLAEIGIVTLLLNFESFFGLACISPFGNHLSISALNDFRNDQIGQKIFDYIQIAFILSLLSLFIFLIYKSFFHINLSLLFCILFVIYLFLNNTIPIISSFLLIINQTGNSIALQVIKSVSSLIVMVIALINAKNVNGWIIGSLLGVVVPVFINIYYYKKFFLQNNQKITLSKKIINKNILKKYIIPFALLQLSLWFFFNTYRNVASKLFDLNFLGELALTFTFASQFCSAFEAVISQIYLPDFYRILDQKSLNLKLANYGTFLKKIQSTYLLFFMIGTLPFITSFFWVIAPKFSIQFVMLIAAWIFNFVRICFNLFSLITQVTQRPKMIIFYVLLGILFIGLFLSGAYILKKEITKLSFLIAITLGSIISLLLFIYYTGKKIKDPKLFFPFFLCFLIFIFLLFLPELNLSNFDRVQSTAIIILSSIALFALGINIIFLQKKLKVLK